MSIHEIIPDDKNKFFSACVVLNSHDQFLVLQRSEDDDSHGMWDLCGGGVETGETIHQAMVRELEEECNIRGVSLEHFFSYQFTLNQSVFTSNIFITRYDGEINLSSDHQDYKWVGAQEAIELLFREEQKQVIVKYLQERVPVFFEDKVDWEIKMGERGVAVIKIKETGEFVVYDKKQRGDLGVRFPGGHIDAGENGLQAAIREVWEEVGIENLEYIKKLGFSHGFYFWGKDKLIHKLDHFYLFEVSLEQWLSRKTDQQDEIGCFLADEKYVLSHANQQIQETLKQM